MNSKKPIRSKNDILKFFHDASVPRKELLIGIEVERSAVYGKDLSPVQYSGPSGYLAILKKLVDEVGWKIINKDKNGNILALKRGGSEIHTESDGRLELVSKPRKGLINLCREYEMHAREISEISKEFDVHWISTGIQPFAKKKEITYAFPEEIKKEYGHYRKHYCDWQGALFSSWDKKNNSIHVNLGYTSEKDAISKFQILLKISPILIAMFANSPVDSGKYSGYLNHRARTSALFCPKRTKVKKSFFEEDFSFEKWIDFLLSLPMRHIRRKGRIIYIPLTFGEFLKSGFKKYTSRMEDFYLHIKSVWNEVRIKNYLEYRGIDCVPPHLIPSVPAIIRALTLNSDVMKECQDLVKNWKYTDHLEIRENVYRYALQGKTPDGKKMLDFAKKLLDIASFSLQERHKKKKERIDASRFLWPIKEYIFIREQSPAEYVMEMWKGRWHRSPRKLLRWSEK
jgi:glutamate--cysteine ligase